MPPPTASHPSAAPHPPHAPAFELRVEPRGDIGYGIALHRLPTATDPLAEAEQVVRIWGDPLLGVMDQVLAVIRRAGYRTTDLRATRRAPFRIRAEEDAVRLGLLFAALKPLRKGRRIEEVARAVMSMEREEVYYWFSKVTAGPEQGRVRRALRIMASDE